LVALNHNNNQTYKACYVLQKNHSSLVAVLFRNYLSNHLVMGVDQNTNNFYKVCFSFFFGLSFQPSTYKPGRKQDRNKHPSHSHFDYNFGQPKTKVFTHRSSAFLSIKRAVFKAVSNRSISAAC
jgi:hypothetical protein